MRRNFNFCGIDFGTTNSTVAVSKNGVPVALSIDPFNKNPKILKSLIYLNPDGGREIGRRAIDRYLWDVKNISAKPPMLVETGKTIKTFGPSTASGAGKVIFVPEIIEVDVSGRGRLLQSLKSVLTTESFKGSTIFGQFFPLENLLSVLLSQIKERAQKLLNRQLDSVVLGRPVRYVGSGKEKLALERMSAVAKNSGFKNVEFEYEPVGAALNYGIDINTPSNVLVFDFGGGTLDVCIMNFPSQKVISVSGRPIGGDLLDSIIVENKILKYFGKGVIISKKMPMPRYFLSALTSWYQITLLKNVKDLETLDYYITNADIQKPVQNLKNLIINDDGYNFFHRVDQTKIKLSSEDKNQFKFKCEYFSIKETIFRNEFEDMITAELSETNKCLDEALKGASLRPSQIDKVLVTGGSSKIPVFKQILVQKFGADKIIDSDRFTSVALGLGIKSEQVFG
ncbi:MAG: Hsp70 family protein [Candidatus Shapirobacteria bacterium]|jgi:hypothetical chaperone protein